MTCSNKAFDLKEIYTTKARLLPQLITIFKQYFFENAVLFHEKKVSQELEFVSFKQ